MARRIAICLIFVGTIGGMIAVRPAGAQSPAGGLEMTAPPARPAPEFGLEPTMPPEQQGSRDQEFYPGLVRSRHEPAFVKPFVADVPVSRSSRARVGLSGWTAPALPFDTRDSTGGVAFGLTILWGAPAAEAKPPAAEGVR
ncbi:MAG TPA: hypothetical protein VGX21_06565 [Methylomirabilota bacterium]|jgi:hypothetical protein|nr:hypothetical protein [Methylomirabilota bacterium]